MKRIFALVLAAVMMMVSAAFAEAEYSYVELNFDEATIAEIGGDWLAVGDLGVMFYMPDIFVERELLEEEIANGYIGAYTSGDGSCLVSVAYGAALNVEGNPAEFVEELAAYYTAAGAIADVIIVNGCPAVAYSMPEVDMTGVGYFFNDGTQLMLNFYPASNESLATIAGVMLTTFQAA